MKKLVFVICFYLLFFGLIVLVSIHSMYGGYISNKTEQKYLRNINKLERSASILFMKDRGDTLASISKVPFDKIDPSHSYYIMNDVGLVRPGSRLEKALDSIWNLSQNKLK